MKSNSEKVAKRLNALIGKNRDAEKGFAKAADNAKAKSFAFWCNDRSVERKMFNEDLKVEVASVGQDFDESGSLTGDLHRTWMDMKAWVQADSDEAMIKEVISGEKAAIKEYNQVLAEMGLPSSTQMVLVDHLAKIEQGLVVLQALDEIEYQEE